MKKKFCINNVIENEVISLLLTSEIKEAKEIFPEGIIISEYKVPFRKNYTENMKNHIISEVEETKKDITDFLNMCYGNNATNQEVKDRISKINVNPTDNIFKIALKTIFSNENMLEWFDNHLDLLKENIIRSIVEKNKKEYQEKLKEFFEIILK